MEHIDLSPFFQTKAQAIDFSSRIAAISEMLYQTNFSLERALSEQLGIQKKDAFLSLLRDQHIDLQSRTALKEFLSHLQETVASLPILKLTLAFEPIDTTLQSLSQWFLLNIKKQVLFDIAVDSSLIAGAAVSFNGKYKDFTIKQQFTAITDEILNPKPPTSTTQPTIQKHQSMEHVHLGR